jgi:hypothetical protein
LNGKYNQGAPDGIIKFYLNSAQKTPLVIALSRTFQQAFALTGSGEYLMVEVGLRLEKNQDFIPDDHPALGLLREVSQALGFVYAYLDGDWVPDPEEYLSNFPSLGSLPSKIPPWYIPSKTVILGRLLSAQLPKNLISELCDKAYVEDWGNETYYITQPSTEAHTQLIETLRAVPVSFLGEL